MTAFSDSSLVLFSLFCPGLFTLPIYRFSPSFKGCRDLALSSLLCSPSSFPKYPGFCSSLLWPRQHISWEAGAFFLLTFISSYLSFLFNVLQWLLMALWSIFKILLAFIPQNHQVLLFISAFYHLLKCYLHLRDISPTPRWNHFLCNIPMFYQTFNLVLVPPI